jgi:hypothetical protein
MRTLLLGWFVGEAFIRSDKIGAMFSVVTVVIGIVLRKLLGVRKSVL